jgi:lipoprotein-anchoring transpeptidase ErfK/SrfK
MRPVPVFIAGASFAALLTGCSPSQGVRHAQNVSAATKAAEAPPTPAATTVAPTPGRQGPLSLKSINDAQFSLTTDSTRADNAIGSSLPDPKAIDPTLVKAEILLDRANFSPGVIDGKMGENVQNALKAFDRAHGLPVSAELNARTWQALTTDTAPVLKVYTITPADIAGPYSPNVGEDFVKLSKLPAAGYTSVTEALAERFHMDGDFLTQLNPNADFSKAGTQLVVVDPGTGELPKVASIDVSKATKSVTAYDDSHKVVAVFPATVGSTERPSPKGAWKVKGVAQNPDYTYDPSKLTWGPKKAGKLRIPPGPNGPVGVVWIALTAPDYGIHGTPDPHLVGKTASHGCVRLTNWDAEELSKAVKPGVKVNFVTGGGDD